MFKYIIVTFLIFGLYQNCGFQGNFDGFESSSYVSSYSSDLQLTSVSPDRGFIAGGDIIIVKGESFVEDMEVYVNQSLCLNMNLISENEAVCVTPKNLNIGNATISVKREQVIRELPQAFKLDTKLSYTTISPIGGSQDGNTTLTIDGFGFDQNTFVKVDGLNCNNIQIINSNKLTCVTPSNPKSKINLSDIVISKGWQNILAGNSFTFFEELQLISMNLSAVIIGLDLSIVISGSGLSSAIDDITVGGADCINVLYDSNSDTVSCKLPNHTTAQNYPVIVSDPFQSSNTLSIAYVSALSGSLIAPSFQILDGNIENLEIIGSGFDNTVVVTLNGTQQNLITTNPNSITFSPTILPSGTYNIVITKGNQIETLQFKYADDLVLTSLTSENNSDNTGYLQDIGLDKVSISGAGIVAGTTKYIVGSYDAGLVQGNANAGFFIMLPQNKSVNSVKGRYNIKLRNPDERDSGTKSFYYLDELTISNTSPNQGFIAGDIDVIINGSGFEPDMIPVFAGVNCKRPSDPQTVGIDFINSTSITCRIPANANGAVTISLSTSDPIDQSASANAFTYSDKVFNELSNIDGTASTHGYRVGTGSNAHFFNPMDITNDGTYLYVSDTSNSVIKRIRISNNRVTIIAGQTGKNGYKNGKGNVALFNRPTGIVYSNNALYVSDTMNNVIRKINLSNTNYVVSLHAGFEFEAPAGSGDFFTVGGGVDTDLPNSEPGKMSHPYGIALYNNTLIVANSGSTTIKQINISDGGISTIAGKNDTEQLAFGNLGANLFAGPIGVAVIGNFAYISDAYNCVISKLDLANATHNLSHMAGIKAFADPDNKCGDILAVGGAANFHHPSGLIASGNLLYIADSINNKIKILDTTNKSVSKLIGTNPIGNVDGSKSSTRMYRPGGMTIVGNKLYFTDIGNNRIRSVNISTKTSSPVAGKIP